MSAAAPLSRGHYEYYGENLDNMRRLDRVASAYIASLRASPPSLPDMRIDTGIALGICPSEQDDGHKLAIRIQERTNYTDALIDALCTETKGAVDIQDIGVLTLSSPLPPPAPTIPNPLRIGCSVGHFAITAGTLGAFITLPGEDGIFILSNNHVLANVDRSALGDAILSPGPYDGGVIGNNLIATLARICPLSFSDSNLADAALGRLKNGIAFDPRTLSPGLTLQGVGEVDDQQPVFKIGRTTGQTEGRISAIEMDDIKVRMWENGPIAVFNQQIEIKGVGDAPFSAGGDSGSLVYTADGYGVALLFAGSEVQRVTYAAPLEAVLKQWEASLVL